MVEKPEEKLTFLLRDWRRLGQLFTAHEPFNVLLVHTMPSPMPVNGFTLSLYTSPSRKKILSEKVYPSLDDLSGKTHTRWLDIQRPALLLSKAIPPGTYYWEVRSKEHHGYFHTNLELSGEKRSTSVEDCAFLDGRPDSLLSFGFTLKHSPYVTPGRRKSWTARLAAQTVARSATPQWISYPETPTASYAHRYFRRRFLLDTVPEEALLLAVGTDAFTLSLNGEEVCKNHRGADYDTDHGALNQLNYSLLWPGMVLPFVQRVEVTGKLKVGENILAAEIYNGLLPPAGLLVELQMRLENGRTQTIFSDESWLASDARSELWQRPEFNDSGWKNALELGDAYIGPWYGTGDLHHCYPLENQSEIFARLRKEKPVQAQVRLERGGPRLFLDGREVYPLLAWSNDLIEFAQDFREAGIHFLHPFFDLANGWTGAEVYDWSGLDSMLARLLSINPQAYFLIRVGLSAPAWWKETHPNELVQYALPIDDLADRWTGTYHASVASDEWRKDTQEALRAFLRHVEASPLCSRVIGYQIANGIYGEWHHFGARYMPDTSEKMKRACGGIVPDADARQRTFYGLLRDPARERDVVEFYRRFHEVSADAILHFARIVKEETARRVLCGAFYTYLLENLWIQEAGHLASERILESPDIDFLAAPYTYQNDVSDGAGNWLGRARGVGGDGGYRVLLESLKRRGKLYFAEIDPSTCLEIQTKPEGGPGSDTIEGSRRVLERELAQMLVRGNGGWIFDLGPGWYAQEKLIAEIHRFVELGGERVRWDVSSIAQVAAVYDPHAFFVSAHWRSVPGTEEFDLVDEWFLNRQARSLHRIGAPIDFLDRRDVRDEDFRQYKLLVMVNLFLLTRDEAKALRRKLEGSGATVIWLYAPGFVQPEKLSRQQMEELTGFQFLVLTVPGEMIIESRLGKGEGNVIRFGIAERHYPRFVVIDDDAEELGRWVDQKGVAFARKRQEGWTSVYAGTAPLPVEILRWLAKEAGAELWSSRPDIIYATKDAVAVVATENGEREVKFLGPMSFIEGGASQSSFYLNLEMGEVKIFVGPSRVV